jgi:hypothetical protein
MLHDQTETETVKLKRQLKKLCFLLIDIKINKYVRGKESDDYMSEQLFNFL